MRPAVFLDRDGTINVEKNYLYRVEDFEFIPGAPEAIKRLKDAGYLVIVVTNQSGVARGYFSLQDVAILHRHIEKELAKIDTSIDAFYICPHHPTEGKGEYLRDCNCRKGKPGMLHRAANDFGVDLSASFMVGDKEVDFLAGVRAGSKAILVSTGYGSQEAKKGSLAQIPLVEDLSRAVEMILA